MARPGLRVNHYLAWFHRWAGIVLCLLFVMWFASGVVLHFVGFPSLPAKERRAHAEVFDARSVRVPPSQALEVAALDAPSEVRLLAIDGEPTYLIADATRVVAVGGDTGRLVPMHNAATARRIAGRFGGAPAAQVAGPFDYDQWIVHQQFDRGRPFFRVRLSDSDATDLYVSARTGEVLQRTRRSERAWNWCGAVLHWIYFTPVRKDWSLWNQLVWWVSLVALTTSVAGVWLGVIRTLAVRKLRPSWTPFRGWLRWHHLIGLLASLFVVTWIFSGWLSMDHGRLFSRGEIGAREMAAVRGMRLADVAAAASLDRITAAGHVAELSFDAVAGHPLLTARSTDGSVQTHWLESGAITTAPLPDELLIAALKRAWDPVKVLAPSGIDEMYRLAESLPDEAFAAEVGLPGKSARVYLDRTNGRLLSVMDRSRRAYAWTYYALHTLNFPGLNTHPALRTVAIVLVMLLGLAFSITGVIVGVRRLRSQFR